MFEKQNTAVVVGPEDQQLAAAYAGRAATPAVDPYLDPSDLAAAAADSSGRITIGNGASIKLQVGGERRSLQMGPTDAADAAVSSDLHGMQARSAFLVEQMNRMVDPATGEPRPEAASEYNRNALILRQLQASLAYQRDVAAPRIREQAKSGGVAQLQREARWHDINRAQDGTAAALEAEFGRVRIV